NVTIGGQIGSGRAVNQLPESDLLDLKLFIQYSRQKNIDFNYTINATPGDPVYVIYTSGSTGKPKGVIVEHRNVVRLVKNMNYIHFSGKDRILPTGAIAFDISTFELWGPLLNGVRLYFVDEQVILDAEKLGKVINEHEITILHLIPQLFNQMSIQTTIFAGLKYLLVGGDVVRPRYINEVRNRHKNLKILQMYGPTENTTFTTSFLVDKDYEFNIPIGKPVSNSTVYILVGFDWLQPVGIVGELCAGGDGVARGYLNSPGLTGEKFIPNPFVPGQKLYKTGDLARWLPEGNIEFIGRMDNQVKIRGYRIELGEIESVLSGHEKIQESIIITKEDEEKNPYLCAYFTSEEKIEISELRKYLSQRLPDYMIPLFFVPLRKMRLTPNGKIDRKALPEPEVAAGDEYAPPRDEVEKKLLEIWSEVLRVEKDVISIDSNFFKLGGHSLKAAVLISKLHKAFDVKIPLAELWRSPFIRDLAAYVKEKGVISLQERFSSIEPAEGKEYYPLSSAQKRLYVLQHMKSNVTSYNIPQIVALEGVLDKRKLEKSFRELIQRHESLRTSVELINEEPMQRIYDEVEFNIEYFDMKEIEVKVEVEEKEEYFGKDLNASGEITRAGAGSHHSSFIIHHSFVRPFDLSRAPLMRVGLIETGDNRYIMMADVHHIVTDGTSMDVLVKEFLIIYSGGELPPLRLQYKDYSNWQKGLHKRQRESIKDQEEYWLKQFESEPPLLNLPTDYPRPAVKSFAGSSLDFQLSPKQTGGLNDLAMNTETSLYMVLLAIYNILLSKISGQEDMIVGTPVAARRHVDLEKIIGMFVNTLAIRTFVPGTKTFTRYLQDVKKVTLNAFEKQDYPFEDLIEKAAVERDTSRNPLFDVMFVLQNISRTPGKTGKEGMGGLKLKPYAFENKTAKFDLVLFADEEGDKLNLVFEYCTKLFEKETIIRLVNYFKRIISSLIENPHMEISEIDILAEEEKKQLLYDFNDTEAAYPKEKTIHRLFAEQADKTPDSTAVIGIAPGLAECCTLSYGELNRKSAQLAHLLRVKGIKRDTIVGITAERTVEMVVGILGILKAGGAYLPIDPDYPEDRVNYMLKDAKVEILVKKDNFFSNSSIWEDIEVISIDDTLNKIGPKGASIPPSTLLPFYPSSPSNLAYVLYTSGSAGNPKAVLVEHSPVVNFLFCQAKRFGINDRDRVLQFSSPGFDASVEQIFITLSSGAALVLIDKNTLLDIDKFEEFITTQSITHLHAVPSFL
ncbi:amino acid adenylation domain-containing protein, partial [Acidobacteriota bacterium]